MQRSEKNESLVRKYKRIAKNLRLNNLEQYFDLKREVRPQASILRRHTDPTLDSAEELGPVESKLSLARLIRREVEARRNDIEFTHLKYVSEYAATSFMKFLQEISADKSYYLNEYSTPAGKKQGFSNLISYTSYLLAKKTPVSYKHYLKSTIRQKGYSSFSAYHKEWAKKRGLSSYKDYQYDVLRSKGFQRPADYKKYLAQKKGLASAGQYEAFLARKRMLKREYRELARWIRLRLGVLGWTQSELAKKTGISKQMVALYAQGKTRPRPEKLKLIRAVLEG
ncbi:MAG: helix-turn-helix transcriptional regulator [Ignavibacteriales bacterium]|nr:helix-turn-helix transcriptional regulator [Ignavibacteriales bacterium]